MKKNLVLLTGIVFVLTILLAGGCKFGEKKEGTEPAENSSEPVEDVSATEAKDSTEVSVYLRDTTQVDGTVHLQMYNEKHPDKKVIDDLETVVYPGYTVIFSKAQGSKIDEVTNVRTVEEDVDIFSEDEIRDQEYYRIEINHNADTGRFKYEISFIVKGLKDTIIIDPFLKIPPQ